MDADDLDLLTTDELFEAIKRRSDACILVRLKDLGRDTEEREFFHNGLVTALGLAEWAKARLLQKMGGMDAALDE